MQVLMMPYFSSLVAQALGAAGRAEEGLAVLAPIEPPREPYWEPELYRIKGELLLQLAIQSRDRAAQVHVEQCFDNAFTVARQQQAKAFELRAATSLARLKLFQGRKPEAYKLIQNTYQWFTEGFDTPDLQEARALMDRLRQDASNL
jgi:predicted ATPase